MHERQWPAISREHGFRLAHDTGFALRHGG
jgi:hypothetical protein